LRTTLIQLAWLWLCHQSRSALTLWFEERVRRNAGRFRKTTIVALGRKLLIALWKYVAFCCDEGGRSAFADCGRHNI
jgi:transposase